MRNLHVDPPENVPIKNGLTEAERQRHVDLHFERGQQRQAEDDLRLARTIELGRALQRFEGG